MPTFDFTVSSLTVVNPRSLFNDSDYATLAINVLAADNTVVKQYGPVSRSLGNLGKGTAVAPKLSLTSITVPDGGSMAVAFVVVNQGAWSWNAHAINALELAGTAVLGALAAGTISAPGTATAAGVVGGATIVLTLGEVLGIASAIIYELEVINILFADCDGPVVPGVLSLGQTELLQYAVTNPWLITYQYPGTNSPDGCGANSIYSVSYSVEATPPPVPLVTVPNIIGMTISQGVSALNVLGLIGIEKILKTTANTPGIIFGQNPPGGQIVAVHTPVTYDVQSQHTIQA